MQIPEQNIPSGESLNFGVVTNLYKNGELVGSFANSITDFDFFGSRFFNSAVPYAPAAYQVIRTTHASGNYLGASTITNVSPGVYKASFTYVNGEADATVWQWTGGWVQRANSALETYKVAAGTWSINWTGGDTLIQEFVFTLTGAGFTSDGLNRLANRIFTNTGTTIFDDIACLYYGVERQRIAATYAAVSATVHTLTFAPAKDDLANAFRIYDAVSAGNYCYEKAFTQPRIYLPTYPEVIKITLSQS